MELTEIEVWGDQDLLTPVKLVVNTEISKKYNYHKSICPQAKMRIFFSWVVEDGAKKKKDGLLYKRKEVTGLRLEKVLLTQYYFFFLQEYHIYRDSDILGVFE